MSIYVREKRKGVVGTTGNAHSKSQKEDKKNNILGERKKGTKATDMHGPGGLIRICVLT